jgi:hypothetical protein
MTAFDTDTVEIGGNEYHVAYVYDEDSDAPWDREDGHGPVSEWTRRDKLPGERVLIQDRGSYRYYDFAEASRIAKRDGWGVSDPKPGETKGEQRARAVQRDFDLLRGWCNNDWHYMGIVVMPFNEDGEPRKRYSASLWGIESNADEDYRQEVIKELVADVDAQLEAAGTKHYPKAE